MTTAMPAMRRIATNGIELAVYDPGGASALPPIVLCHGFPEIAFSWRHQLAALPAAGLRVIAPDQRGYDLSDRPAPVEAYDMEQLTGDLVGLLDAYGWDKAVFCGHDWGGFVVWQMGARYPDRTAGVIGLNTPYTKRPPIDPIALYRQRFGDDFYIVYFQTPDEPEARFEADLEKSFRFFLRKSGLTVAQFEALPSEMKTFALQIALDHFDPATDTNQFLSDDEIAAYVAAFAVSGFRGPINWYRNFTRNWERSAAIADHVAAPSLMIMAEDDLVLPPSAADGMEKYVPNLTKALVTGSGHWTQQEQPEAVNRLIIDWMKRTFG